MRNEFLVSPIENSLALVDKDDASERRPQALAKCSNAKARASLPFSLATRFGVLPLSRIKRAQERPMLTLAVWKVPDAQVQSEICFVADAELEFEVLDRSVVERAIYLAYHGAPGRIERIIKDAFNGERELSGKSAGPELLDAVLDGAIAAGASDIHLFFEQGSFQVRYRVDGQLRVGQKVEGGFEVYQSLVRRLKILAKLDTTLTKVPQEGGYCYRLDKSEVRLRVSILPASGQEKVVVRLLDDHDLMIEAERGDLFGKLGYSERKQQLLKLHLMARSGLILCAGPTGSGKSTTLAAMIKFLNPEQRNIVTVEDPIERRLSGVCQVELNAEHGLGFEEVLPVVLRQDPDVIVIGEIRNSFVANVAVQAALTGHLVLSTIHASDSLQTILRLRELGVSTSVMSSALKLIVNQRLVPLNCKDCLREVSASRLVSRVFALSSNQVLKESAGCKSCDYSGVRGRKNLNDFLPISQGLKKRLATAGADLASYDELSSICQGGGGNEFSEGLRSALCAGSISPTSAMRLFEL